MELDANLNPEAVKAAEEEARKQATGSDGAPLADVADLMADGSLGAVIDGIGSALSGAADVVGGLFSGLTDL